MDKDLESEPLVDCIRCQSEIEFSEYEDNKGLCNNCWDEMWNPLEKFSEDRTIVGDFQKALLRVDQLLAKYEPKHKGAWRKQNLFTHANHLRIHAQAAEAHILHLTRDEDDESPRDPEENLASCACRALMLLQRYLEEKNARQTSKA